MKNYLESFFKRYDYPEAASAELLGAYDILSQNDDFNAVVKLFYDVDELRPADIERAMEKVSRDTGVHEYTVKYLYYLCLTKFLPKLYKEKGIPEEVMWDSLEDFRYKLLECLEVYGVAGFHSTSWFYGFLRATMFKLGRMEYHIIKYKGDTVTVGGQTVTNGDDIINVHIPSSGESFATDARLDSYAMAYDFFKNVIGHEVKCFFCHSWLLFPEQNNFLPEKSNVRSFMKDFKLVTSELYTEPRSNMWRIFGRYGEAPAEKLPRDTSLRRAYADYLATGAYPGWGKGVFFWDDVNKKTVTE